MNEQNSYYAFISYNSADEKWAKWLQHNLEYYHIPSALCKEYPELPKKIRPVFWYKQDLSGTKLKQALNNELSSSKYLIVICSPDSAKADWVNDEVVAFIEQGKGDITFTLFYKRYNFIIHPIRFRRIWRTDNNKIF